MAGGGKLLQLLQDAVKNRVSDIHFRAGLAPAFRVREDLEPVAFPPFSDQDMVDLCLSIIKDEDVKKNLKDLLDYDGSFEIPNLARFRFNLFRNQGKLGAIFRLIPTKIPSIQELGLPVTLEKIAQLSRGLVLVTGATGSGKSSTLAAMINQINENQRCHILTIEDPVEFVHPPKRSRLTQREVGRDTKNFASALKSALRQDPDVILVGEMRDVETLDIALKAAETGHLVFSTVHTTDAVKTIGRLVAMFPPEEQRAVRLRLAENLEASISQRLVPTADGQSRVVAMEIMRANLAIRECIADEKRTQEMNSFIDKAHEVLGSQTFDLHLANLVKAGLISQESALEAASNSADFQRNITFGESQLVKKTETREETQNTLSLESYGDAMENVLEQVNASEQGNPQNTTINLTSPENVVPIQRQQKPAGIPSSPHQGSAVSQVGGEKTAGALTESAKIKPKIPPVPKIPA